MTFRTFGVLETIDETTDFSESPSQRKRRGEALTSFQPSRRDQWGEEERSASELLPSIPCSFSSSKTHLVAKLGSLILLELLPVLVKVVFKEIQKLGVGSRRDGGGSKNESSCGLKSESGLKEKAKGTDQHLGVSSGMIQT